MNQKSPEIAAHNAAIDLAKARKQDARDCYLEAGKKHCRENRLNWKSARRQLSDMARAPSLMAELAPHSW